MRPFFLSPSLLCLTLALPCVIHAAEAASVPVSMEPSAERLIGRQLMTDLTGSQAKRSIRGATAVWTQVMVQGSAAVPMASLNADLRTTDLEGQLRDAKFRLMDPDKKSLAIGLRPTVVLSVLFVPKDAWTPTAYYLVTIRALQDAKPLGGDTITMATWINVHDPVPATGVAATDTEAVRAAARDCVKTFIEVTQDKD
jgi:hypothetical protein